jgi:hypothetical protein
MAGLARIAVILSALIVGLASAGCGRGFEPTYDVDGDLQVQVDRFLEEAAMRGHDLTISNLIMEYDPELAVPTCGTCNSHSQSNDVQKVIGINPHCPITYNEQMEALVFHELGHCVLGREHDFDLLPNGDPRSMMTPGNYSLYSPCLYQIGEEDCDFTFKRDYYLDELFDERTPVPDWAR